MFKFLMVSFLCLCMVNANAGKNPVEDKGLLFFSIGDWPAGTIVIDGEDAGHLHNGFASVLLKPGVHHLTKVSKTSSYGYSGTSVRSVTFSVIFEIKPGKITSLGTIVFLPRTRDVAILYLKNDRAALAYLEKYETEIFGYLDKNIIYPDEKYANDQLDLIRQSVLNEHKSKFIKVTDFVADNLGVLIDIRNPGSPKKIETNFLEPITTIAASPISIESRFFLNSLQELYRLEGDKLVKSETPADFIARNGYQTADWLMLENYNADLAFSTDLGKSWKTIDTPIAKKYTATRLYPTDKGIMFGPITGVDNEYDKRVGYIIDPKTAETKQIEWAKYVFSDSRFYWLGDTLLLDPVSLGNKAFLFSYNSEKDKWKEISLPNRSCEIKVIAEKLILDCKKGDSFMSLDAGESWQKSEIIK